MQSLHERAVREDPRALFVLGAYHGSGAGRIHGLSHDETQAAALYERAAATGDVEATYTLAMCYATGSGVAKSPEKAIDHYRAAAAQGHLEAQKSLANHYTVGTGVAPNPVVAARYARMAAEQGDRDSVMSVGDRFLKGDGVKIDQDKAKKFYELADEMGHAGAQERLRAMVPSHPPLQPPWDTYVEEKS